MDFIQIKETCIYVQNLEVCFDFYHGVLGLELISKVEQRHVFFRLGSSVLLCFLPEVTKNEKQLPAHFAYGKQHLALEVKKSEYATLKNQLIKKEINITHVQIWHDDYESFYFEDPDGHVLEVVMEGMWD